MMISRFDFVLTDSKFTICGNNKQRQSRVTFFTRNAEPGAAPKRRLAFYGRNC